MVRSTDAIAREAKIAELKRLILTGSYETLENLEDAVDSLLWSEQDGCSKSRTDSSGWSRGCTPSRPRFALVWVRDFDSGLAADSRFCEGLPRLRAAPEFSPRPSPFDYLRAIGEI